MMYTLSLCPVALCFPTPRYAMIMSPFSLRLASQFDWYVRCYCASFCNDIYDSLHPSAPNPDPRCDGGLSKTERLKTVDPVHVEGCQLTSHDACEPRQSSRHSARGAWVHQDKDKSEDMPVPARKLPSYDVLPHLSITDVVSMPLSATFGFR
ncbi:hypothetical protein C8Q74DRAFT_587605 [Fomes fomentarius]|nr:hypothetical protein C8Q74DRAFT_587605 [Fomes fomentarius]